MRCDIKNGDRGDVLYDVFGDVSSDDILDELYEILCDDMNDKSSEDIVGIKMAIPTIDTNEKMNPE